MLELLFIFGVLALLGALALGALKALMWLVILPFKVGFWLLQGVVGLIVIIPLAIVGICVLSAFFPLVLALIAVPVVLIIVGFCALLDWVF